jgi:hypothetical protein
MMPGSAGMGGAGMGGDAPSGSWTHSFEEDEGDLLVFRPTASFPFPPSRRGRERLDFDGGVVSAAMPGPDDRSRPATVTPVGANRFRFEAGNLAGQVVEIVEHSAGRLTVRPASSA